MTLLVADVDVTFVTPGNSTYGIGVTVGPACGTSDLELTDE